MKVYTSITIDMATGLTVKETSFEYKGPVDLCKGGGGSSGHVTYQEYLADTHEAWLIEVDGLIPGEISDNPYADTSLVPYDPSADLAEVDTAMDQVDAAVDLLGTDLTTAFDTIMDFARTYYDTNYTGADLAAVSTAWANRQDAVIAKAQTRFAGSMAGMNAQYTSSFVIGLALIEQENVRDAASFNAELSLKDYFAAINFGIQSTQAMMQLSSARVDGTRAYAMGLADVKKFTAMIEQAVVDKELEYDVRNVTWAIGVYQDAANLLAGVAGGVGTPDRENRSIGFSSIAGALGGASVGSAFGIGGTAIGALAGGGLGALQESGG